MTRAAQHTSDETQWRDWLTKELPLELCQHVSGVVEREGNLLVFAISAAWSARLRYALQALEPKIRDLRSDIQKVTVRVLPRAPGK